MAKEQVLLLHGIAMAPHRMFTLATYLRCKGYEVLNIGYPSRTKTITECADHVASILQGRSPTYAAVHSMGGLVLLDLLARDLVPSLQRAVLIGTPFGGSEVADYLAAQRWYRAYYGPAGQELTTTHRRDLVSRFMPLRHEIGVISGTRGWEHPWFLRVMKQAAPHDSLVSVANTLIPGMTDHLIMSMSHGMLTEISGAQTLHFFKTGQFKKPPVNAV